MGINGNSRVAVIGGTGLDEMPEFVDGKVLDLSTRFGEVNVIHSESRGGNLFFLPRHGLDHATPPAQINYRAQIAALKKLDVRQVIGVCAVGSLRTEFAPGSFAVLSDFIDLTKHRAYTFFDDPNGPVVHTDFTTPYCPAVSRGLVSACEEVSVDYHDTAVYVGVDGPRYETPSEIGLYSSWGGDVVGMTNVPEVVLAREAGLCYGAIGVVTNLACGLASGPLRHDDVRAAVAAAERKLQAVIHSALSALDSAEACRCASNTALVL